MLKIFVTLREALAERWLYERELFFYTLVHRYGDDHACKLMTGFAEEREGLYTDDDVRVLLAIAEEFHEWAQDVSRIFDEVVGETSLIDLDG